ncbi:MAG: hypothetical protein LBG82_05945 [Clostridiales Family XIII bacterium]|nr:hypothetical protein [Clostridiales Family XIII bacterium]
MMESTIIMPKLGMTNKEGTVERWLKSEGDLVAEGDEMVEISSDKIVTTVEAKSSGILKRIVHGEGTTVPVGTPIGIIAAAGE